MTGDEICRLCACSELPGAGSSCGKEMLRCALHKRFVLYLVVGSIFTGFWLRASLSPNSLDLMQKVVSSASIFVNQVIELEIWWCNL